MDIWNFRVGNLIEENPLFLDDLTEDNFKVNPTLLKFLRVK